MSLGQAVNFCVPRASAWCVSHGQAVAGLCPGPGLLCRARRPTRDSADLPAWLLVPPRGACPPCPGPGPQGCRLQSLGKSAEHSGPGSTLPAAGGCPGRVTFVFPRPLFPICEMVVSLDGSYDSHLWECSVLLRYHGLVIERLLHAQSWAGLPWGKKAGPALKEPPVWGNRPRAPRMKINSR